jgi:hypothetical protein
MARVCRAGRALAVPEIKAVLVHDATEHVTPYAVLLAETTLIHTPQIV